jgi:hypothetical protein
MDATEQHNWFLSYKTTGKPGTSAAGFETISNIVLTGIHPLVWLSKPPAPYRVAYVSAALFFCEIGPDTVARLRELNYISIEDHLSGGR